MREATDHLLDALAGSFTVEAVCDVFRGTDRVLQDVRVTEWEVSGSLSAEVKYSGSATLVIPSVQGESYVPHGAQGVLSPFGATLTVSSVVSAGQFRERTQLGWFKITRVVSARDSVADVLGSSRNVASIVEVEFRSLEERTRRAGFVSPEQPAAESTCWEEIRRICLLPVSVSTVDVPVPDGLTWTCEPGRRLKAVLELGRLLGGTVVPTADGRLTVAPDAGDPVLTLRLGEWGTVLDVSNTIDSDGVANEVVGIYEAEDGTPIYARAVATGVLGDDDRYTVFHESPTVKDQAAADLTVEAELARITRSQSVDREIECVFNPLLEVGDFVTVEGWDRPLSGQVVDVRLSADPTMNLTLREVVPL